MIFWLTGSLNLSATGQNDVLEKMPSSTSTYSSKWLFFQILFQPSCLPPINVIPNILSALVWVCVLTFFVPRHEKAVRNLATQGLKNPLRNVGLLRNVRFLWLFFIASFLVHFLDGEYITAKVMYEIKNTSLWVAFYFFVCTPLPPRLKYEEVPKTVTV